MVDDAGPLERVQRRYHRDLLPAAQRPEGPGVVQGGEELDQVLLYRLEVDDQPEHVLGPVAVGDDEMERRRRVELAVRDVLRVEIQPGGEGTGQGVCLAYAISYGPASSGGPFPSLGPVRVEGGMHLEVFREVQRRAVATYQRDGAVLVAVGNDQLPGPFALVDRYRYPVLLLHVRVGEDRRARDAVEAHDDLGLAYRDVCDGVVHGYLGDLLELQAQGSDVPREGDVAVVPHADPDLRYAVDFGAHVLVREASRYRDPEVRAAYGIVVELSVSLVAAVSDDDAHVFRIDDGSQVRDQVGIVL